jgi:GAF domain-containing protein
MNQPELQAEIERFGRLYVASSHVSHAVVRSRSREELLNEVVRLLVEVGEFAMALISWHDPATRELVPVARFGDALGYSGRVRMFADERPEGQGPAGSAFRVGTPYVCNDFLNDPRTVLWRDAARSAGWRASAAFPVLIDGLRSEEHTSELQSR